MQAASAKELTTAVATSSRRRRPTLLGSPVGRRTIAVISVTGTAGCALRRDLCKTPFVREGAAALAPSPCGRGLG